MKHMKQICLLLAVLACFFLPAAAFAEEAPVPAIQVQLNGETLQFSDAAPVNENGRVYVPFRAVFEALDAEVDYRAEDGLIMAEKEGTSVTFKVNESAVSVDNGTENEITIDAPPFIRDGRTYVPVRFAAQTFGLTVGWDSTLQTVVMLDKAALKEAARGQYTIMDSCMEYSKSFNEKPLQVDGDIQFDMQVANGSGEDARMIPVTGSMALDGISTVDTASMDMAVKLDLASLQTALEEAGSLTDEDKTVMEQLKAFDMQVIANLETGKVYMKSGMFALAGMDGTAWYMMDLNEMIAGAGMDLKALMEAAKGTSYEAYMMTMIDTLPVDDALSCAMLLQTVTQYQDSHFQKVGNNYVSSMKQEVAGMTTATSLTIKTNGSDVTGWQEAMSMYLGTAPLMTVKADQTGSKTTMTMTMNMEGMMTMNLSGTMTCTATSEQPLAAPPAGSVIMDMTADMMSEAA